jgi:hypothetical protein
MSPEWSGSADYADCPKCHGTGLVFRHPAPGNHTGVAGGHYLYVDEPNGRLVGWRQIND